jgi:hypothetical protein
MDSRAAATALAQPEHRIGLLAVHQQRRPHRCAGPGRQPSDSSPPAVARGQAASVSAFQLLSLGLRGIHIQMGHSCTMQRSWNTHFCTAPFEVANSCRRLPNSRKEGPLFFFRKSFFHSLGDKCQTAAPGGPSTPPAPTQDLGHSRSRIVIEPASVPEAAAKPALRHAGL